MKTERPWQESEVQGALRRRESMAFATRHAAVRNSVGVRPIIQFVRFWRPKAK
jgi:hypothetical protein